MSITRCVRTVGESEDETRAIARFPHLDVEIWHRRLPEEQAEQLAISLTATPSFEGFVQILDRRAPWPWLALQPWLVWGQIAQAAWQPWLAALSSAPAARSQPAPMADRPSRVQGRSGVMT